MSQMHGYKQFKQDSLLGQWCHRGSWWVQGVCGLSWQQILKQFYLMQANNPRPGFHPTWTLNHFILDKMRNAYISTNLTDSCNGASEVAGELRGTGASLGSTLNQSIFLNWAWKSRAWISSHVNFDPPNLRFNWKYSYTKLPGLANGVTRVAGEFIWLVFPQGCRFHKKFHLVHDESRMRGFPPSWNLIHIMS